MVLRIDATHVRNYSMRTAEFHVISVRFRSRFWVVLHCFWFLELQMAFLIPEVEDQSQSKVISMLYVRFYV